MADRIKRFDLPQWLVHSGSNTGLGVADRSHTIPFYLVAP